MKATDIKDNETLIKYLQETIDRKDEQIKTLYEQIGKLMTIFFQIKFLLDGPDLDSTGSRVTEWTAHQQRCKKKKIK